MVDSWIAGPLMDVQEYDAVTTSGIMHGLFPYTLCGERKVHLGDIQ